VAGVSAKICVSNVKKKNSKYDDGAVPFICSLLYYYAVWLNYIGTYSGNIIIQYALCL